VPPEFSIGMIALWYNSIGTIPDGWHLCDGNGGTIDLRNKMVVPAGDEYAPGATGGSVTHSHGFTGDGHSHTIDSGLAIGYGPGFLANTESAPVIDSPFAEAKRPPYMALAYIQKVA